MLTPSSGMQAIIHVRLSTAERLEAETNDRYAAVVADDDALIRAFEARYAADPAAFGSAG